MLWRHHKLFTWETYDISGPLVDLKKVGGGARDQLPESPRIFLFWVNLSSASFLYILFVKSKNSRYIWQIYKRHLLPYFSNAAKDNGKFDKIYLQFWKISSYFNNCITILCHLHDFNHKNIIFLFSLQYMSVTYLNIK